MDSRSREEFPNQSLIDPTLFKARPASVLERAPFVPQRSDKPLSEIDDFQLNSDRRAEEREAYEVQKKHREAEQESLKRQVRHNQRSAL